MKIKVMRTETPTRLIRCCVALACAALLLPGNAVFPASPRPRQEPAPSQPVKIPADQLDALVAPIALYPDNLLSQTLVASTYPLEIIQLQQWLEEIRTLLRTKRS